MLPTKSKWGEIPSVQALQHPPEYAMTLQVLMENHTVEDRTAVRIAKGIAARTTDRTTEVAVQDSSVCARSARSAKCRIDMRTVYPTDQEYQDNLAITSFKS
jgi:hypothetical protein